MEFEWDPAKALSNRRKHRVSFELAATVFDDVFALRVIDEKHSTFKEKRYRYWQIGESDSGVLVVVFTIRANGMAEKYRITSARKASKREKVLYEINKGISISEG